MESWKGTERGDSEVIRGQRRPGKGHSGRVRRESSSRSQVGAGSDGCSETWRIDCTPQRAPTILRLFVWSWPATNVWRRRRILKSPPPPNVQNFFRPFRLAVGPAPTQRSFFESQEELECC